MKNKRISRREFIKGAAAGAAGIVTMGIIGACTQTDNPASTANAGSSTNSENVTEAKSSVQESLVETSPAVNSVPVVSNSLPEGISEEELVLSNVITDTITEFSETYEYDVVVIGAGTAGVPAALTAAEEGVSVACLQNFVNALSQGNTSTGIDLDNSDEMAVLRFMQETNELCGYRSDWNLLKAFCEKSGEAIKWVEDRVTKADCIPNTRTAEIIYDEQFTLTRHIMDFRPKPRDNGTGMIALAEYASQNGVDFYYETPGVQLIVDNGKVTGVIGMDSNGNYLRFNARKGVILATGDYQNNEAMVAKYCPDVLNFDRKQVFKTGDGHLMGMIAGGCMEPVAHTKMLHDFDSGPMFNEPFLMVNTQGERFTNEESIFEMMNNICRHQPDPGWYSQIFDNDYEATVTEWGGRPTSIEDMQVYIPGAVEDPVGVQISLIDTYCCDTLEELAEKLEIQDVPAFMATIERYNELCESGMDVDFGKYQQYMKPIKTAPFWGIRKHLRVSAICSGLLINENAQVLSSDGEPIPGLFAAGNCSGQFYGGMDYPLHCSGMSIGRCFTFGRIAGKYAANQA